MRTLFHKTAFHRIIAAGAEIDMLNAQRLDRGGHGALTVYENLHPKSDTEPARLKHAAPEGRAAHGRFNRLGEVFPASHERTSRIWVEQEDFIVAVTRPHMDCVASFQRHQRRTFKQRADLNGFV